MKTDVETLSPTRVRLSIEVPFEELEPSVNSAYKRIATQINIPGFRKGKVPPRIIDQRVGRGAVLDEAVNEALPKAYGDAVTENELNVLGQPDVEIGEFADGSPLAFTAEVDVRPEIELPDFTTLEATVDAAVVDDIDIDNQLEDLRERFATLVPAERAAEPGDLLSISVAGHKDGEPVDELTASGLTYEVGSDSLLPGLDAAVTGLAEGEEATFEVTPESGDLEGQQVEVTVTVATVRERELPQVDDEFAQTVSEFDTLDDLRDALRTELQPRKQIEQMIAARDAIMAALLETVDVPLPEGVVAGAVADHFKDGHGDDGHRAEFETQVRESMTRDFVLDTIADRDDLQVSQAEITEYLIRQAPQYGMTPDQFAQAIAQAGQVGSIIGEVRRAKAVSVVLEAATVRDGVGELVELSPKEDVGTEDAADVGTQDSADVADQAAAQAGEQTTASEPQQS